MRVSRSAWSGRRAAPTSPSLGSLDLTGGVIPMASMTVRRFGVHRPRGLRIHLGVQDGSRRRHLFQFLLPNVREVQAHPRHLKNSIPEILEVEIEDEEQLDDNPVAY